MGIQDSIDTETLFKKLFDAGANAIWPEMKKLRGQAPEQKDAMRKRWVWELIQNASDCIPKGGKINIDILMKDKKIMEFTHDGVPFTYDNLIDLITQISSKEGDSEEKTGKFGTGFISTHLLDERVRVKGVFKQSENIYKNLSFIIDRSGSSYQDIRNKIKETLNLIESLKNSEDEIIEKPNEIRTTFYYDVHSLEETKEAVKVGLEDLKNTVPFVLALNKSIQSIQCNGIKYQIIKCIEDTSGEFQIIDVSNSFGENVSVLIKEENEVAIALLAKKIDDNKYRVLPFVHKIPKLFCKFPLIGTEGFCFPVIINCSKFDVEKDRNAIHEGSQENKDLIKIAIKLYRELINYASQNEWEDMYNLCLIERNNNSNLQSVLYEGIEKMYEQLLIVEVNTNGKYHNRVALKVPQNGKLENQIRIPICEKNEYNDEFWDLVNSFAKFYIPTKESYLQWYRLCKNKIEISDINNWYIKDKELCSFKENFHDQSISVFKWLNKYYDLWMKIKGKDNFIREAYILNQNYKFVDISEVSVDVSIDNDLKNILIDLGDDIKDNLVAIEIKLSDEVIVKKKDNKYISKQIQDKVNRILSNETLDNAERDPKNQLIFNKLTNWFIENPKISEDLFETLYKKRNLLSTPEENIRRFKIAEKIESNNIKYDQLDDIIENHNKISKLIENLGELSGQEIKEQLKHISVPSPYSLEKFNSMMERSIKNIYDYLSDISDYKISPSLEEWKINKYFKTVFPAIKNKKDINIIIRPSDDNKLIFFYDEELEALDDTNYELWTDDGQGNTRMITLGDIIKTTGITRIPLTNIYKN
jgi:hypothetical protein